MPDARSFEDLLQRFLPPLKRLAAAYTRDRDESEELLQEIALAIWTSLPRFRGESSERTWIYRVAHNTALRFMADRRRRGAREAAWTPEQEPVASSAATPEQQAMQQERLYRLWQAVRELDWADRQVAVLYLEGLSTNEIESITGMTAGSIATRLTRIRQKLTLRLRGQEVRP
ncbi:MAG: sigma-70 family RNA polymerase sigma factor [Bryobacterales bacterium]|nr:sigma-70 family RNA polymerase sigma factor [Bryobacterales bacterium]